MIYKGCYKGYYHGFGFRDLELYGLGLEGLWIQGGCWNGGSGLGALSCGLEIFMAAILRTG